MRDNYIFTFLLKPYFNFNKLKKNERKYRRYKFK